MSIGETCRNLGDLVRAAAERGEHWDPVIVPWRIEASQDRLHKGLEQCGCAFSPDEPEDGVSR
jgi:hypothetical protein